MNQLAKRIAIIQSNYVPWKGYFDIVAQVDEFILLDDVQFTKRDWRNRNRFKTSAGVRWLTIPVRTRGRYNQKICDTEVSDLAWGENHAAILEQNYRAAPYFKEFWPTFEPLYGNRDETLLSRINRSLIETVCRVLNITTKISWSSEYPHTEGKTAHLIDICRRAGADEYVSGPAAASYLDVSAFAEAGIALSFADYSGYKEYPQLHGPFVHEVSILDLIFNTGPRSRAFMKAPFR